ncbi:hypothetical protein JVT61DRAFT_12546 [Boletus reticuloceps]|uniref:CxC1-like cysteine cluster associated with KDZ transposases domain-containing protein n=1 Tax=Boletus reticuloceps TaxID=495285 RepID=A0A8I2YDK4_9AGAM|nr:hypothetical protein JVT61DRAFT_12546 [Boletus reticuloceps]
MPLSRFRGLSKAAISYSVRHGQRHREVLTAAKQRDRVRASDSSRRTRMRAMAASDQDLVNDMMAHDEFANYDEPFSEGAPSAPNADLGCEDELDYEIFTEMASQMANSKGYRRIDHRVRMDRTEAQTEHWALQMDHLVAVYLEYRAKDTGDGMPSTQPHVPSSDGESCRISDIGLVDVFSYCRGSFHLSSSQQFPNESLISHGYLGCSPLHPTVTISIRTLAVFRQYHRSCPGFSIHAQCKALCHLHRVPYRPYLSAQFSAAFDIYLKILARVEQSINAVLGCNTPDWRMRNACPACFYKLKDEPPLEFSYLASIDGNNSLKRWASRHSRNVDSREPRSDYTPKLDFS